MDNEQIIQQLRSGQQGVALQELYKSFPSIAHFICTNGGQQEDARDVFQDCLLILYRNVLKTDFTLTCSLSTYLFSIAKYIWKDELRKRNRISSFNATDFAADVEEFRDQEAEMQLIERVLLKLGDKCRQILELFYYKKKGMDEIARLLDYRNTDTVKTQKYKCIERAKNYVNEVEPAFKDHAL